MNPSYDVLMERLRATYSKQRNAEGFRGQLDALRYKAGLTAQEYGEEVRLLVDKAHP